MKPPGWEHQIVGTAGGIQSGQHVSQPFCVDGLDAGLIPCPEKSFQAFMSE